MAISRRRRVWFLVVPLLAAAVGTLLWATASSALSRSAVLSECSADGVDYQYPATQIFARTPVFTELPGQWAIIVYRQGTSLAECTYDAGGVSTAGPYTFTAVRAPGVVLTVQDPLNSSFWSIIHIGRGFRHPQGVGSLPGSVVYRMDAVLDVVDVRSSFNPSQPSPAIQQFTVGYVLSTDQGAILRAMPIRYCGNSDGALDNRCTGEPPGLFPPGEFH